MTTSHDERLWNCPWPSSCVMQADGYCPRCDKQLPLAGAVPVESFCPASRISSLPTNEAAARLVGDVRVFKETVDMINSYRITYG